MKTFLYSLLFLGAAIIALRADPAPSPTVQTVTIAVTHSGQVLVAGQAGKIIVPTLVSESVHGAGHTPYSASYQHITYNGNSPLGTVSMPAGILTQSLDQFGCFYTGILQDGSRIAFGADLVNKPLIYTSDLAGGDAPITLTVQYEVVNF